MVSVLWGERKIDELDFTASMRNSEWEEKAYKPPEPCSAVRWRDVKWMAVETKKNIIK